MDSQSREEVSQEGLDVFTWVQSFTIYVSVRAAHDPSLIPELMAYMYMIVRASQDFGGTSWVNYDTVFRRQAAATGVTAWSRVGTSLFCFFFYLFFFPAILLFFTYYAPYFAQEL